MDNIVQQNKSETKKNTNEFLFFLVTNQNILVSIIVLVVFFILIIGGVKLYQSEISVPRKNLVERQAIWQEKKSKLDELKSVKVEVGQLESDVQNIYWALPYEANLPDLYLQIIGAVERNGLVLGALSVSEPAEEEVTPATKDQDESGVAEWLNRDVKLLEVNLNVNKGDYFALKKFVSDLSDSLRIMDIKSISYSPESNSYAINLRAYYMPED